MALVTMFQRIVRPMKIVQVNICGMNSSPHFTKYKFKKCYWLRDDGKKRGLQEAPLTPQLAGFGIHRITDVPAPHRAAMANGVQLVLLLDFSYLHTDSKHSESRLRYLT